MGYQCRENGNWINYLLYANTMVLILDGRLEHIVHVWTKPVNLICWRHFYTSCFFSLNTYATCYHLIYLSIHKTTILWGSKTNCKSSLWISFSFTYSQFFLCWTKNVIYNNVMSIYSVVICQKERLHPWVSEGQTCS